MLALGNYVQWKSIIKRYIDTKPNSELIHYCIQNPPYMYQWAEKTVLVAEGSSETTIERYMENYKNVSQDIRDQLNAEAEAVQIILTGIDNDIYSTVDACPNACEMWKAIERLKQGESINVQDLETNLYWEFGKFNQQDGVNRFGVFLLQLQPEWQRFVTLVKQSQELKTISYHKLYDILKQHQNEVNEIRAERLARTANPLTLVAQQQPVYHPQNHPTQNTQYSSTRSQQSTRNRGKAIVTSSAPTYDPEPATVTKDEEMSKEKEIDKLMALISLLFKKIYKPTNNNLRTSSNTSRANQDNSPRINRGTGYDNHRVVNVAGAMENVDDTNEESEDQELEAHYMYMAQIQEVTPDPVIPLQILNELCTCVARIMPPRRFKKKSVKRIVEKRVAKAIEEYEKTRTDSNNAGGSGSANTGGTVAPEMHGCSYKTFTNGKPHSFNGTEGVVGLKRWFEKMEQVFEICKCAEDDKVKFAMCTFEGRALTWWNGNVQTLGLANANQIPWSNVKAMMTTEYCPATEIQRMEQELWTLTLKGDDIEAYNNRFHELVLMCPELVSTEKKKIEKYIRGFPEGIKGNVTSSKPATLHDAINMARELIEQGVQAKALRIGDSNKRKWEDQQGNNYHQQQNRRQEAAKVYVAAPAKGRGYAGNLPWCNRCKAHHQPGLCPPRCGKCHKLGHQEEECRTRIPVAGGNSLQNVTCFGCGNHGHYRSDCPELKNQN
ncbi:ribonuclease H-like domain-containing protein [Tanacetum coccineum]